MSRRPSRSQIWQAFSPLFRTFRSTPRNTSPAWSRVGWGRTSPRRAGRSCWPSSTRWTRAESADQSPAPAGACAGRKMYLGRERHDNLVKASHWAAGRRAARWSTLLLLIILPASLSVASDGSGLGTKFSPFYTCLWLRRRWKWEFPEEQSRTGHMKCVLWIEITRLVGFGFTTKEECAIWSCSDEIISNVLEYFCTSIFEVRI